MCSQFVLLINPKDQGKRRRTRRRRRSCATGRGESITWRSVLELGALSFLVRCPLSPFPLEATLFQSDLSCSRRSRLHWWWSKSPPSARCSDSCKTDRPELQLLQCNSSVGVALAEEQRRTKRRRRGGGGRSFSSVGESLV